LRAWHEKYEQAGLTIVGVHSPEFPWEKPLAKVKDASARLGIKFPVVQDNNFDIWQRYGIKAWPTIVLVDKKGHNPLQPYWRGRVQQNRVDDQTIDRRIAAREYKGG
jgi:hypothetical protein